MKNITLRIQESVGDCFLDLLDKQPSSELETTHKLKYNWSDETYQKILALRQAVNDIGAVISGGTKENGQPVRKMSLWLVSDDRGSGVSKRELIVLKMCNNIGIRFDRLEYAPYPSKEYPFQIIVHFKDNLTKDQQEKLNLLVEGYLLNNC